MEPVTIISELTKAKSPLILLADLATERKSNNWLDQWQRGKLGTGSRVSARSRSVAKSA